MAFTSKMQQYCGSISGLNTTDAIKQAVDHTLGVIKVNNAPLLSSFARKQPVDTSMGAGYNLAIKNVFDVVKIVRGNYVCLPVSAEQIYDITNAKSIYFAQPYSPAYLIDFESNLRIFPDTATTDATTKGFMYLVYNSDAKTIHDANETIKDNTETAFGTEYTTSELFPDLWKQYIVLHASDIILVEKINQLQDAIDKAQNMIDTADSIGGDSESTFTSVQEWLVDEDEDMVGVTLQTVGQELNRATAIMNKLNAQMQVLKNVKTEFLRNQGMGGVSDSKVEGQI